MDFLPGIDFTARNGRKVISASSPWNKCDGDGVCKSERNPFGGDRVKC